MLVCTNDGFTGVDHLALPTGANEQKTVDLPRTTRAPSRTPRRSRPGRRVQCSRTGSAAGKPNGNDDTKTEAKPVGPHPGIQENGRPEEGGLRLGQVGRQADPWCASTAARSEQNRRGGKPDRTHPRADADDAPHNYRITVQDLTIVNRCRLPVAATTRPGGSCTCSSWQRGLAANCRRSRSTRPAGHGAALPLRAGRHRRGRRRQAAHPEGREQGRLTDTVTFTIKARSTDRLSLVAKLVCTNDGFAGSTRSSCRPPGRHLNSNLFAYDAGVEQNTERSEDIVDGCVVFGPEALRGKPNGNDNSKTRPGPSHRTPPAGNADSIRRSTAGRSQWPS